MEKEKLLDIKKVYVCDLSEQARLNFISKFSDSGDLGYPSSVELNDGKILTAYYQHDVGEVNCIKYTIWSLDEIEK